jgi:hypothetical protein
MAVLAFLCCCSGCERLVYEIVACQLAAMISYTNRSPFVLFTNDQYFLFQIF